jgi:hypothetical protein
MPKLETTVPIHRPSGSQNGSPETFCGITASVNHPGRAAITPLSVRRPARACWMKS